MPRPDGPQFMHLYRGLEGVDPDAVDYEKLGMHWSASPGAAREFVRGEGVIVKARIDKRHIMTPEHPDWKEFQIRHSVFGPNSQEQEYPVIKGSPVRIKRVHHISDEDDDDMFMSGHDPGYHPGEEYETLSKPIPRRGTA